MLETIKKYDKKLDRFTTFLAIGALIVIIPMVGFMFGKAITDVNQDLAKWVITDDSLIEEVYADTGMSGATGLTSVDHSVEGVIYKVSVHDGIGTSESLR